MKKLYTLIILIAAAFAPAYAQEVPLSYYQSVNGLRQASLKTALANLIYNHTSISDYYDLPIYFKSTDSYTEGGKWYWWDMYSNIPVTFPYNNPKSGFGTYMNREHSFPKSWWGGLTNVPAYVDLYHLYPSESEANMKKSNHPLGEVSSSTYDNGVVKVGYAVTGQGGGDRIVFEPSNEYKGDFARTYMYFVTCYQNMKWDTKYMYMVEQNTYPTLQSWAIDLLLKWAREDPVSQKERDRNEAVYKIQNNRNPFIDFPDLFEYIWGDKVGETFYVGSTQPSGPAELTTPVQGTALDFSQTALGQQKVANLTLMGNNLKGNLSLVISGADASMFSIESNKLASSLVNAPGGTAIPITYKPTAIGNHSAQLLIYNGGLTGSIGVQLIGEALEAPKLTAPVAIAASDITANGYTANWMTPEQVVDYYIVTRTIYVGSATSSEDILAEANTLDIEWAENATSESYNVRSVRLGIESPRSNEILVERSGITDINAETALGWTPVDGGVRIVCSAPIHDVTIYDIAGRTIRIIDHIDNDDIIELPLGAYIITTPQSSTAVRILVR